MKINNFISRSFQENTKNQSTNDVNKKKETIIQLPIENISDGGGKDINENEHRITKEDLNIETAISIDRKARLIFPLGWIVFILYYFLDLVGYQYIMWEN